MKKVGKKILTGVITAGMVLSAMSMSALADDGGVTSTPGSLTADGTISVTGVQNGDTAVYYQIVNRNTETGEWELSGSYGGLTVAQITDGVTSAEAHTISAYLTGHGTDMNVDTDGTTLSANVEPGTYVVVITPGSTNSGVVYNPVVVSSDYDGENHTNTAVAKKTEVTVDKKAGNAAEDNDNKDVAVGDEISYTITPVIPLFPKNYTAPVYKVTDTLSAGLELADANGDKKVDESDITVNKVDSSAYTITVNDNSGFTVNFNSEYLKGLTTAPTDVTITYKAKVTSDATYSVNEMTNTAKINFSNSPSDTTGNGTDSDKTNHYTFTLDGTLNGSWTGQDQIVNKELIKTAVDKDGNPVLKTKYTYTTGEGKTTEASPLAGATFKLTGENLGEDGMTCTTDANGFITFAGLDAGIYTLTEVSAPAGYVKDSKEYKVEIVPTYGKDADGNEILTSYKVKIDGADAANFIVSNQGTAKVKTEKEGSTIYTSLISNVKAAGLPSTGGVGTTMFYVIGGVLVAGAAILLITKRRMNGHQ